jgi:hypothetical protein
MEHLIEAVRLSMRDGADPAARRAGLVACREILAALEGATAGFSAPSPPLPATTEAAPGASVPASAPAPMPGTPASSASPPPPLDPAAIASVFASLGKLPPEQLLDLAIARLRAALPAGATVPAPSPIRFQLIPLQLERSK